MNFLTYLFVSCKVIKEIKEYHLLYYICTKLINFIILCYILSLFLLIMQAVVFEVVPKIWDPFVELIKNVKLTSFFTLFQK